MQDNQVHPLPGEGQKFIRNNKYFTICIYGLVMLIASAVIFKSIMDIDKTAKSIGRVLNMLSPFLFGALIAFILNPLAVFFSKVLTFLGACLDLLVQKKLHLKTPEWLRKRLSLERERPLNRVLSLLISYALVIGLIVLVLLFVIPELYRNIVDLITNFPAYYNQILEEINKLQEQFPDVDIVGFTKPITDAIPDMILNLRNMTSRVVPAVYEFASSVANLFINVIITIIVSVYMLYDKKRITQSLWRILYALVPEKKIPEWHEVLDECHHLFSSFVTGKFLDSVIIGFLCFFVMRFLELEYAPLISLIVGVTNMIPYFGPFIGAIPGLLILLFINPLHALIFLIMILCLQQFDGLILGPKILGGSTGMKPLWIIFAITVGGYVASVVGMFLGVPLVAFLSYLLDRYLSRRLAGKNIPDSRIPEQDFVQEISRAGTDAGMDSGR